MKKRFLSLLCVLALCLGLLPVTAEAAAEGAPNSLYVGSQQVISSSDNTIYWTTDMDGKLAASTESGNWNVKYDPTSVTLTLRGATINGGYATTSPPYGAGIYAPCSSNQSVALTIELIGTNTITGNYGIYVNANQGTPSGAGASLVIKNSGDNGDNGSLTVTGTGNSGLLIASGTGNASLTINDASVVASSNGSNGCAGVFVQSGASTTDSPNISLSIDGGSLTASSTGSSDGIRFYVGSSQATGATTSLTVSNNAIVDARNGGISASRISVTLPTPTPTGDTSSGIVFDGSTGTVYGSVILQDDLEIKSDETLTVPDGSKLDCNNNLTNNGTILASGGTVTGNLSGGTAVTTPSITTQPTGQTVTEGSAAEFSVTASDAQTYQWQQSTDSGSNWTNIESATSAKYTTEATTTSMSGYQYRCVVKSASGVSVISNAATLTVNKGVSPTSYSISADVAPAGAGTVTVNDSGTSASVAAGSSVTLNATANEGYRFTGWTSSGGGTFGNASSASTTFTMPASDVTVTAQFAKVVTGVKLDKETLELYTGGSATLTAAVEPSDATNQNVTWQSDNANVATVQNGTVTAVGAGETTISVTTEDGRYTATCKVTVTQSTYSISADTTALKFGNACPGYDRPAAQTVTITNTGNQTLTLTQPASTDSFEVGSLSKTKLAPDEKATFTVQPKSGLAEGTYSENITVSGSENVTVTIPASFTVKHELKMVAAKEPTCTEAGNIKYWYCENCNKYFSDENGSNEITSESTILKATGHSYDNGKCTVCGTIAPDFKVTITAGANGTWQKGTKDGLSFTSNAAFADFQKVQVDGKDLDASNYTVKEGSTIVTLKAEYLETLSVGKHTLAIVSETGTATTEFTIKAAAVTDDTQSPQTGDSSNMMLWIALLFVSGGALGTGLWKRKKERA